MVSGQAASLQPARRLLSAGPALHPPTSRHQTGGQMDPEPWNSLVTAHTSPGSQLRPCDVRVASWPPHGLKMGGHSERVLSTVYPALPALSISGAGRQAHLVLCPHLTAFPWGVESQRRF